MNKLIDGNLKNILLGLFIAVYLDVSPRKVQLRENIICFNNKEVSKMSKQRNMIDSNGINGHNITGRFLTK
jgi:hypothetical protein